MIGPSAINNFNNFSVYLHNLAQSLTHELNSIVSFNRDLINLSYELLEVSKVTMEKKTLEETINYFQPLPVFLKLDRSCAHISETLDALCKEINT